MKIPLAWLKEYISFDESVTQICEILTQAGIEVDAVYESGSTLDHIVAVSIKKVVKHPSHENLRVASIFDGEKEHEVVSSAPNCDEGLITAWAKPGSKILSLEDQEVLVSPLDIHGVHSYGVLCSEKELGLSDNHEGLIDLGKETKAGLLVKDLVSDTILEVSLTPNLGHCLSILGIARELSASLERPYHTPKQSIHEVGKERSFSVQIKDKENCLQYYLKEMKIQSFGKTPLWMKTRLQNAGIRSINYIVDSANYVMLALGVPMHVFDADMIKSKKIVVQSDQAFEDFITLDGKGRNIPEGVLMITDGKEPLAIAGVMGGQNSMVTEKTKRLVIEAAEFSPQAIRKSMKKLQLRSESSNRFEKGVDPEAVLFALEQLSSLIQSGCDAEVLAGTSFEVAKKTERKTLLLRLSSIERILGVKMSQSEAFSILARLEMDPKMTSQDHLEVLVPSYRRDITQEIDLVEEIARIYGFGNLPISSGFHTDSSLGHDPVFLFDDHVRDICIKTELLECIHCDLISPSDAWECAIGSFEKEELVHVLHPSALEQSTLRANLLPGFLHTARHNFVHGQKNLSLFEIGKIHYKQKLQFFEKSFLGILLSGMNAPYHHDPKPKEVDFFDLKGKIETILAQLGIENARFERSFHLQYHPGRQAQIVVKDRKIGILGQLHPTWLQQFSIEEPVFFAQLCMHELEEIFVPKGKIKPLNQFPAIIWDWTVAVSKKIPLDTILQRIQKEKVEHLSSTFLLDIYNPPQNPDEHNLTFRFIYRSHERTLKTEEVEKLQKALEEKVARGLLVK